MHHDGAAWVVGVPYRDDDVDIGNARAAHRHLRAFGARGSRRQAWLVTGDAATHRGHGAQGLRASRHGSIHGRSRISVSTHVSPTPIGIVGGGRILLVTPVERGPEVGARVGEIGTSGGVDGRDRSIHRGVYPWIIAGTITAEDRCGERGVERHG